MRILLVEDVTATAAGIELMLKKAGYVLRDPDNRKFDQREAGQPTPKPIETWKGRRTALISLAPLPTERRSRGRN